MSTTLTASDFLSSLEEAVHDERVTASERKKLIADMSTILNIVAEFETDEITFEKTESYLLVETVCYKRTYYKSLALRAEDWTTYLGSPHRDDDKPAIIEYYENGHIRSEEWCEGGKRHRNNGEPARIRYSPTGQKEEATWIENGNLFNAGGPAYVEYDNYGIPYEDED